MKTPICDFVEKYKKSGAVRLHMPGHKGNDLLGVEDMDITEIVGADSLYDASGIILESEQNASRLFGFKTYYSTEGSSQCIRAMAYLVSLFAADKGRVHGYYLQEIVIRHLCLRRLCLISTLSGLNQAGDILPRACLLRI